MHDTVAQGLTGIILQLESAAAATAAGKKSNLRKHIQQAHDLAKETLEQARRSVMAVPPQNDGETLEETLQRLVETMRSATGPTVGFRVLGNPRWLPAQVNEELLRVAKQSFTNALQHAHAGAIAIELDFSLNAVMLRISDDGRGFSLAKRSKDQIGLRSMKQRASALGAELRIASRRGKGTRVAVEVPLPATP